MRFLFFFHLNCHPEKMCLWLRSVIRWNIVIIQHCCEELKLKVSSSSCFMLVGGCWSSYFIFFIIWNFYLLRYFVSQGIFIRFSINTFSHLNRELHKYLNIQRMFLISNVSTLIVCPTPNKHTWTAFTTISNFITYQIILWKQIM